MFYYTGSFILCSRLINEWKSFTLKNDILNLQPLTIIIEQVIVYVELLSSNSRVLSSLFYLVYASLVRTLLFFLHMWTKVIN